MHETLCVILNFYTLRIKLFTSTAFDYLKTSQHDCQQCNSIKRFLLSQYQIYEHNYELDYFSRTFKHNNGSFRDSLAPEQVPWVTSSGDKLDAYVIQPIQSRSGSWVRPVSHANNRPYIIYSMKLHCLGTLQ